MACLKGLKKGATYTMKKQVFEENGVIFMLQLKQEKLLKLSILDY